MKFDWKLLPLLLRKWRLLEITITAFLSKLLWDIMQWVMSSPYQELQDWQVGVVSVVVSALVAGLFAIVNKACNPVHQDEDEKGSR